MPTTKTAAEIWRDDVTDGVPATGAHEPVKSEIRQYLGEVEDILATVETAIAAETATALHRFELARRRLLFATAF